jgi:hypothetical protein
VPEARRQEYLDLLAEYGRLAGESAHVKGFYVMESEERAGDLFQFVEFADGEGAAAFAAEERERPELRAALERLRELVPAEAIDSSLWRQRL